MHVYRCIYTHDFRSVFGSKMFQIMLISHKLPQKSLDLYDSIMLITQLAICRQLQKDNKEKVGKPRSGKKPSGEARPQKGNARGSKKDRNSTKPKKGVSNKTKTPKDKPTEPPASPAKTLEQPVKKKLRSKRH